MSGGMDYLLQDTGVLRLTLEHFQSLLEHSVALAFPLAGSAPASLKVSATGHATVHHSAAIGGP